MAYVIPTTIISGFKAIGKTTQSRLHGEFFRDLDDIDFRTLRGEKNHQWPENYIEQIKALENAGMYRAVFVSGADDVREAMGKAGIRYTNLYPKDTPKMKELILERMKRCGASESQINYISDNWNKLIESMKNDQNSITNIELEPHTLETWPIWAMMG